MTRFDAFVLLACFGVLVAAWSVWVRTPDETQQPRRPPRDARRPD